MVLALGFMVVLLVVAAGVHGLVLNQLHGSARLHQRVAAFALAEGGIARTAAWFTATNYQIPAPKLLADTVPVGLLPGSAGVVLPANHPNGYTDAFGQARSGVVNSFDQFLSNQTGPVGTYGVVASLMATSPETWEVIATAQVGPTTQRVGAVFVRERQSLFTDALFGRDFVTMHGNAYTDSYDSSLGPYGGSNVFQTGHVRSDNDITLSGNATVRGDAIPGPDHVVSTSGNAKVTGVIEPATSPKQLPLVLVPGNAVDLGAISLQGNATRTLIAGTYRASSLSISGNGQLIIDARLGPVNLYVSGSASIGGNGISNQSNVPSDFNLVQSGTADVTFSGNAAFSGTVYAPNSVLSLTGNGTMFGAFIGAGLRLSGNGAIHFDEVLRTTSSVPGPLRLTAQWNVPPAS